MAQTVLSAQAAFRALTHGRFPQTILLAGEAGCGKTVLALQLASYLLCTSEEGQPCGTCRACHKVHEGIHPDLTILNEGESDIKVDTARALRTEVTVRPNDGKRRVTILHHAHHMNVMAQNALLKTLEEPPAYAFFILTTEKPGLLLPTILSRCTKYELSPVQKNSGPEDIIIDIMRSILGALAMGDEASLLLATMALEKQQRHIQRTVLLTMQSALRDALFCANALPEILLPQLQNETAALARNVESKRLLQVSTLLNTLASRIDSNAAASATSSALCAGAFSLCHTKSEMANNYLKL